MIRVPFAARRVGVFLLVLVSLLLTCYRIAEPAWEMGNQGYLISQHVINARNFHRFGPFRCRLCLLNCYGDRGPGGAIP